MPTLSFFLILGGPREPIGLQSGSQMTQENGEKRDIFEYGSGGGPGVPFGSILRAFWESYLIDFGIYLYTIYMLRFHCFLCHIQWKVSTY